MRRFRYSRFVGAIVIIATAPSTLGCYESHVGSFAPGEGPPDSGTSVVDADVGPDDPFYPMCRADDPSVCPPVDESGNRGTYGYTNPSGCLRACQCRNVCKVASDCPRSLTGTSEPECIGDVCALPCDGEDVDCPVGMDCVTNGVRGVRFCMWAHETTPGCAD